MLPGDDFGDVVGARVAVYTSTCGVTPSSPAILLGLFVVVITGRGDPLGSANGMYVGTFVGLGIGAGDGCGVVIGDFVGVVVGEGVIGAGVGDDVILIVGIGVPRNCIVGLSVVCLVVGVSVGEFVVVTVVVTGGFVGGLCCDNTITSAEEHSEDSALTHNGLNF